MDLNLNNNFDINRVIYPTPPAPEEGITPTQLPNPKKSTSNPAIDGLSALLSNTTKLPPPPKNMTADEKQMHDQLVSIDQELTALEAEMAELNSMAQDEIEQRQVIIEKLRELEKILNQIDVKLQEIYKENNEKGTENKKLDSQLSEANLLKNLFDAQREQQRLNDLLLANQETPGIV